MNLKSILIGTACILCAGASQAVPAKPGVIDVTMPDGTTMAVRLVGDEYYHLCLTEDGYPLVEGDDGYYYYGEPAADGRMLSSGIRAANASARDASAREWLSRIDKSSLGEAFDSGRRVSMSGRMSKVPVSVSAAQPLKAATADQG